MAITKIQSGAIPAEAIDTTHIGDVGADKITGQVVSSQISDLNVTHAKLHTTMDLSSKTVTLPTLSTLNITGNVGIGETSPLGKLHVKTADSGATADASADELVIEGSGNTGISILSGASNTGSIYFGDSGTNWDGYIAYNQSSRSMTLGVAAGGGTVSIDSSGNVGIGTSSPQGLIDLTVSQAKTATSGATFARLGKTNEGSNYASLNCEVKGGASAADRKWSFQTVEQGVANAGSILFQPDGGSVGIATSSPSATLHVSGQTRLESSGEAGPHTYRDGNSGNDIRFFSTNGTFASPTAKTPNSAVGQLHYSGHDGTTYRQNASIVVSVDGTVSTGTVPMRMTFHAGTTTNTERMRIDSSGNVGINKTAPSAKLHVVDSVSDSITAANAVVKIDGTGGDGLSFGNTQSSPYSSWMQAGYLADGYNPAFNNGYPILINPIGGNVMIGSNVPNSYLHIDKRTDSTTSGTSQFQIRADGNAARAERIKRITYCYRPLFNQYTYHRIRLGGGVYGSGQSIRYRANFTTGHAAGHGFVEGVLSVYAHHSTTKMHLTGHTKYVRHYSNGSYYGWTSNPDVDFFFSNNTGTNACVIMRLQGHGNHNSGTFDLICDHHIDLEIHGSDNNANTEMTLIGHSAPGDMGTVFSSSTLN